jgi:trehalose synthase
VGNIEVNAFQSLADVVVQKSTREGFGLTVSEALWKGRPFIGGDVGGIPLQVRDGETGYLVGTVEECADRCLRILRDPEHGRSLGLCGKEHVRENFLTPRYLRDYLRIFTEVLAA